MKLYIDCDPGIDDCFALGYLLTRKDIDIVGIGSVTGNGIAEKMNRNLRFIVSILRPDIKIFKGSTSPIIEKHEIHDDFYHGESGIGDFWQSELYKDNEKTIESLMEKCDFTDKSAVLELINLSKEYAGDLVILALGPLTNIALAQLLDPLIGTRIRKIIIMGGNFKSLGNSQVYCGSEFNFSVDPESAQIVLNRIQCPKTVFPMDVIGCPIITKEMFVRWNTNEIFRVFLEICVDYVNSKYEKNEFCDLYAALIVIHDQTIKVSSSRNVTIELDSHLSRGNMIVDFYNNYSPKNGRNQLVSNKFSSIELIEEVDTQKIIEIIEKF